jgi:hypothetical protein
VTRRESIGRFAEALGKELRFTREPKSKPIEAEHLYGGRLFYLVNTFIERIPVAAIVVGKEEGPGELRMENFPRDYSLEFDCVNVQSRKSGSQPPDVANNLSLFSSTAIR